MTEKNLRRIGADDLPEPAQRPRNGSRRVTMTDVARSAGCSQATVSFVLNKTAGVKISGDTSARVIEAARALGYAAPSFAHVEPATSGPGTAGAARREMLGFVVDQLSTSPEAVVAIDGVRQATWEAGTMVLVTQTMNSPEMEERTIRMLLANGVGALLYMTIFTRKVTLPDYFANLPVPVVLLNCYTADQRFPAVVPAEVGGGQRAAQHLIDGGHRRIGMITGEGWMDAARDRLRGYRRALGAAGIGFDPALVIEGDWSASSGYEGARRLLALPERPTAIFCQNDRMAIGCYEALKEAGLDIPRDMSVIGYDDEEISRHLHPQLTTLVLPHRAMGGWAVRHIAHAPQPGRTKTAITRLDCPLIERRSVARPAGC